MPECQMVHRATGMKSTVDTSDNSQLNSKWSADMLFYYANMIIDRYVNPDLTMGLYRDDTNFGPKGKVPEVMCFPFVHENDWHLALSFKHSSNLVLVDCSPSIERETSFPLNTVLALEKFIIHTNQKLRQSSLSRPFRVAKLFLETSPTNAINCLSVIYAFCCTRNIMDFLNGAQTKYNRFDVSLFFNQEFNSLDRDMITKRNLLGRGMFDKAISKVGNSEVKTEGSDSKAERSDSKVATSDSKDDASKLKAEDAEIGTGKNQGPRKSPVVNSSPKATVVADEEKGRQTPPVSKSPSLMSREETINPVKQEPIPSQTSRENESKEKSVSQEKKGNTPLPSAKSPDKAVENGEKQITGSAVVSSGPAKVLSEKKRKPPTEVSESSQMPVKEVGKPTENPVVKPMEKSHPTQKSVVKTAETSVGKPKEKLEKLPTQEPVKSVDRPVFSTATPIPKSSAKLSAKPSANPSPAAIAKQGKDSEKPLLSTPKPSPKLGEKAIQKPSEKPPAKPSAKPPAKPSQPTEHRPNPSQLSEKTNKLSKPAEKINKLSKPAEKTNKLSNPTLSSQSPQSSQLAKPSQSAKPSQPSQSSPSSQPTQPTQPSQPIKPTQKTPPANPEKKRKKKVKEESNKKPKSSSTDVNLALLKSDVAKVYLQNVHEDLNDFPDNIDSIDAVIEMIESWYQDQNQDLKKFPILLRELTISYSQKGKGVIFDKEEFEELLSIENESRNQIFPVTYNNTSVFLINFKSASNGDTVVNFIEITKKTNIKDLYRSEIVKKLVQAYGFYYHRKIVAVNGVRFQKMADLTVKNMVVGLLYFMHRFLTTGKFDLKVDPSQDEIIAYGLLLESLLKASVIGHRALMRENLNKLAKLLKL